MCTTPSFPELAVILLSIILLVGRAGRLLNASHAQAPGPFFFLALFRVDVPIHPPGEAADIAAPRSNPPLPVALYLGYPARVLKKTNEISNLVFFKTRVIRRFNKWYKANSMICTRILGCCTNFRLYNLFPRLESSGTQSETPDFYCKSQKWRNFP